MEGTGGAGGLLRIDFDEPEERLEELSWDAFCGIFEDNALAFLYQEKLEDGSTSRFNKRVDRKNARPAREPEPANDVDRTECGHPAGAP